jgi:phenylpyruvate tautomerase PptA (4-oxalocrotonate tautomerase family)
MSKIIITCAVTGGAHTPTMSDALPCTPAIGAWMMGSEMSKRACRVMIEASPSLSLPHYGLNRPARGTRTDADRNPCRRHASPDRFPAILPDPIRQGAPRMPTYAFTTASPLTAEQRARLVESVTTIHQVEATAPRYFVQVVFYNVENLFDTRNDPSTNDEDFLPEGELHWTQDRLATKLDQQVRLAVPAPGPAPGRFHPAGAGRWKVGLRRLSKTPPPLRAAPTPGSRGAPRSSL